VAGAPRIKRGVWGAAALGAREGKSSRGIFARTVPRAGRVGSGWLHRVRCQPGPTSLKGAWQIGHNLQNIGPE
jgi:hypothetical protein